MNKFIYKERKRNHTLLLIPGWASDYRIFASLDLDFNYILPVRFSPFGFKEGLLALLEEKRIKRISILGWSLGGFVGRDFSSRYPGLVEELILVSVRKRYGCGELKEARESLKKNKKAYLYSFYSRCFHKKERFILFKRGLLRDYCDGLDLERLLWDLDYLEDAEISSGELGGMKKIKIIHGAHDRIAPIEEIAAVRETLPSARFICLSDAGHIPFLEEDDFNKAISCSVT